MNARQYLMDGHKLHWHLDRVAAWQAGEVIAPIYVEISPVSYCNHQCVFCGLDFARGDHLALDADILCRRLEEMGKRGVKSIMLAGEGEPLLHRDLPRIVASAKASGIDVSVTTNGTAGNFELWEKLLPHLSWLRFSMDAGSASVHAKVHRVDERMFDKTIASLRDALSIRNRHGHEATIGVQYLMIQQNLDDIESAIRLYDSMGVDYISFKPYSEHPQMLNKSGLVYTQEMLDRVENAIEYCRPSVSTQLIYRKAAALNYKEGTICFQACHALPFWGYLSSKGDFYTCSVFLNDERFKVGNIHDETMEAIFWGERRRVSIKYGYGGLQIGNECRLNCRMARINEFLEPLRIRPEHVNFI
jgi:radical SAM protein with 4Fe4S-binding SPASM domain